AGVALNALRSGISSRSLRTGVASVAGRSGGASRADLRDQLPVGSAVAGRVVTLGRSLRHPARAVLGHYVVERVLGPAEPRTLEIEPLSRRSGRASAATCAGCPGRSARSRRPGCASRSGRTRIALRTSCPRRAVGSGRSISSGIALNTLRAGVAL